jgi:hypothetical protein
VENIVKSPKKEQMDDIQTSICVGGADSVLLWFQKRDTIATALQPFDLSLETVVQCIVYYKTSARANIVP